MRVIHVSHSDKGSSLPTHLLPSEIAQLRELESRSPDLTGVSDLVCRYYPLDSTTVPVVHTLSFPTEHCGPASLFAASLSSTLSATYVDLKMISAGLSSLAGILMEPKRRSAVSTTFLASLLSAAIGFGNKEELLHRVLVFIRSSSGLSNDQSSMGTCTLENFSSTSRVSRGGIVQFLTKRLSSENIKVIRCCRFDESRKQRSCLDCKRVLSDSFCDMFLEQVSSSLRYFPDLTYLGEPMSHSTLSRKLQQAFIGRSNELSTALDYLMGSSNQPLFVYAGSGSGSSAFLSVCAQACKDVLPGSYTAIRFAGISPESSNLYDLVRSVAIELFHVRGEQRAASAVGFFHGAIRKAFKAALRLATSDSPLVFVLEGANRVVSCRLLH